MFVLTECMAMNITGIKYTENVKNKKEMTDQNGLKQLYVRHGVQSEGEDKSPTPHFCTL